MEVQEGGLMCKRWCEALLLQTGLWKALGVLDPCVEMHT